MIYNQVNTLSKVSNIEIKIKICVKTFERLVRPCDVHCNIVPIMAGFLVNLTKCNFVRRLNSMLTYFRNNQNTAWV